MKKSFYGRNSELRALDSMARWTLERVAIAPALNPRHRVAIERAESSPQDLHDLTEGLPA